MAGSTRIVRSFAAVCAISFAGYIGGTAHAAITYTDLYTLGPPAGSSWTTAIGDHAVKGGQVVGTAYGFPSDSYHAVLWNGSGTPIDLHPGGVFTSSFAYGVGGGQQVGFGWGAATSSQNHALLWNGTNAAIDLNPNGFLTSTASATDGHQQVGDGRGTATGNRGHALLWTGTNAAIDLNPQSGFESSSALGVGGGQQVGIGSGTATGGATHALLWNGSNVAIDLNPSDAFTSSYALAVDGGEQVGWGSGDATGGSTHALLWAGSNVATDLNPQSGFSSSKGYGTDGINQVGWGGGTATGGKNHALFWSGTAASYIDLHSVLPASLPDSYAYSVSGNLVYGMAFEADHTAHAIAWTVPEPATLTTLAAIATLTRRRRGFRSSGR